MWKAFTNALPKSNVHNIYANVRHIFVFKWKRQPGLVLSARIVLIVDVLYNRHVWVLVRGFGSSLEVEFV